jgi:ribosome-binding ATPase YchF (GTP1/OBG family)
LNYITFYTIVSRETRAWAVEQGTTAPEAAGQIHTDMERGFIRADVVQCDKLLEYGSIAHAREHGVLLSEGRHYVIRDRDVVYIHFKA